MSYRRLPIDVRRNISRMASEVRDIPLRAERIMNLRMRNPRARIMASAYMMGENPNAARFRQAEADWRDFFRGTASAFTHRRFYRRLRASNRFGPRVQAAYDDMYRNIYGGQYVPLRRNPYRRR